MIGDKVNTEIFYEHTYLQARNLTPLPINSHKLGMNVDAQLCLSCKILHLDLRWVRLTLDNLVLLSKVHVPGDCGSFQ